MQHRTFGSTGRSVSSIGLGTWQLGTEWGDVTEAEALAVLDAAAESGVTFFDTADVYGDGRSEQMIGRWLAMNPNWGGTVATKMIRQAPEPTLEHATATNFRTWTDRSRRHLGVDTLDLVQLHCPTDDVYDADSVFDTLDTLVEDETIAAYGVSVETSDQALRAIARPNVASVQIVLNAFRQKPLEQVVPAAEESGTAIIARVPLASGLLAGRYTQETTFADTDHRSFNRHGEAFDIGETFAGIDFAAGVDAAAEFSELARRAGLEPHVAALVWVLQQPGVSTVIPGARSPEQARGNAAAAKTHPLSAEFMGAVQELYERRIRPLVHHKW